MKLDPDFMISEDTQKIYPNAMATWRATSSFFHFDQQLIFHNEAKRPVWNKRPLFSTGAPFGINGVFLTNGRPPSAVDWSVWLEMAETSDNTWSNGLGVEYALKNPHTFQFEQVMIFYRKNRISSENTGRYKPYL